MTAIHMLQSLILYSALTCASTPVALRYLYLQDKPPASPVLAAVQTSFAAVILVIISGPLPMHSMSLAPNMEAMSSCCQGAAHIHQACCESLADPTRLSACFQLLLMQTEAACDCRRHQPVAGKERRRYESCRDELRGG